MSGFGERLKTELSKSFENINIIEPRSRTHLFYIGAAKLQPSSSINSLWINIEEYNESGSSIMHQKRCKH
jgi:actin-related protein